MFLALIKNEAGAPHITAFIDGARKGDYALLTSTLSIVEVSNGVTIAAGSRDTAAEARIDDFWIPPSPIQLVEFYRLIAQGARDLMRLAVDRARKLTPLDAVHLATAKQMAVDVIHSYDPDLLAWSPDVGIPVEHPLHPAPPMIP